MMSKEDKNVPEKEDDINPTPLDQLQSTLESLNKSVPDIAKLTLNDAPLRVDDSEDDDDDDERGIGFGNIMGRDCGDDSD